MSFNILEKSTLKVLKVWRDEEYDELEDASAGDYYCSKCYQEKKLAQAKVFWPVLDLGEKDLNYHTIYLPYCIPCANNEIFFGKAFKNRVELSIK